MARSVGYGLVGLAMVLLGILIIVPFLKRVFPQVDGFADSDPFVKYMKSIPITSIPLQMTLSEVNLTNSFNKAKADFNNSPHLPDAKLRRDYYEAILYGRTTVPTLLPRVNEALASYNKPPWEPAPAKCGSLGTTSVQPNGDVIRIYTKAECDTLGGTYAGVATGECLVPTGGSFSWLCRNVINTPKQDKLMMGDLKTKGKFPTNENTLGYPIEPAMSDPVPVPVPPPAPAAAPAAAPAVPVPAPVPAAPVPSLSVNTAKPSSTIDLLKSACQSLLAETASPLK